MTKSYRRHIIAKTIILLMIVVLSLPCSVKREVKQALGIPVASLEHLGKSDKTIACQTFTKTDQQNVSASSQKKAIQKHYDTYYFFFCSTNLLQHTIISPSEPGDFTPIPIYILHEQYLI